MSWAAFSAVEVMSSPRFALKRVGYLAATQVSFNFVCISCVFLLDLRDRRRKYIYDVCISNHTLAF